MSASSALARVQVTFAALCYPNFQRWFVGQALSLAGSWMQSVAQAWLAFQITGSERALGTITAAGTIPALFFMLPAGALADRLGAAQTTVTTP